MKSGTNTVVIGSYIYFYFCYTNSSVLRRVVVDEMAIQDFSLNCNLVDEKGEESTAFVEEKSFRLKKLTDLRKYIKNQGVQIETTPADTVMEEPKFMKEECNLSIKVVDKHSLARNDDKTLDARVEWVKKWIDEGVEYLDNCVFVDESEFDINMRRSRGWSARGEKAVTTTPSTRATSHTVFGAISAVRVVNVSIRESRNIKRRRVVGNKKRKVPENNISVPSDTTGEHYFQFLNDTMDVMDEFPEMKGYYIIMDNAPIYVPSIIDPVVLNWGYVPVYLPPYSPELNPIEHFWAIPKEKVKCDKLKDVETLTSRIIEASEAVPVDYIKNTIQYSVNQFDNCRNKVAI
ncbi:hypothetical protein K501DRAFT_269461 [Backusella circina FSU 941]|nr:hypothetical protein K501DRAFT_269461 [Backusella circina FSU 941]